MSGEFNVNRLRTKAIVESFPGIHLRKLQRILGTSFSTTRYHVEHLLLEGEIVSEVEKGHTRLYPSKIDASERRVYRSLHGRTARRLVRVLLTTPQSLSKGVLAAVTGFSKSTVSECLRELQVTEVIVEDSLADGQPAYRVRDPRKIATLLAALERSPLTVATDSFIDLWNDV